MQDVPRCCLTYLLIHLHVSVVMSEYHNTGQPHDFLNLADHRYISGFRDPRKRGQTFLLFLVHWTTPTKWVSLAHCNTGKGKRWERVEHDGVTVAMGMESRQIGSGRMAGSGHQHTLYPISFLECDTIDMDQCGLAHQLYIWHRSKFIYDSGWHLHRTKEHLSP